MASIRDHRTTFAPMKQLPPWSRGEQRGSGLISDYNGLPNAHHEPPRPIEPGESQEIKHHYNTTRYREDAHNSHRQQLPGVQELLTPSVRSDSRPPVSANWAPINNPPSWRDRSLPPAGGIAHNNTRPLPDASHSIRPSPYHHQIETPCSETYHRNPMQPPSSSGLQRPPSLPVLPLRQPELSSPRSHGHQDYSSRNSDYLPSPYQTMATAPGHETLAEQMLDRRSSSTFLGKANAAGPLFNLQIVGQRDIPGEGLCYVFKDGSTCPTVIDGEPVNPLWGTTKAGKARKRLAQACLNCREKKIKCEPGETSCLQCEKAKRECLRPLAQSQAEMATGAALAMSNTSLQGEWKSQPSPKSTSTGDVPATKRRRSAHTAQQESTFSGSAASVNSSSNEQDQRRLDEFSSSQTQSKIERLRKDSKRPFMEEDEQEPTAALPGKPDVMAQCEDPYRVEPDGTMLFLDLFFAQSAREARMLFPRKAFTRWVKTCDTKCQRECMVLYAVLAVGSIFSKHEFSSFSRICIDRATQAVSNQYGNFSMAVIQARLLLGSYNNLKGKDSLAWDYNGSALRALGAMRFNLEEGCGANLDEYARPYYSFNHEQLQECRRRTFWAAFLMDCYNGFCSGLITTIHEDDVHIRLPCNEKSYEDGHTSTAPVFQNAGMDYSNADNPAAHTIAASILWKEVFQFMHRSEHYPPSIYVARYDLFLTTMMRRLSDWYNRLPAHLTYSRENLERAIVHDYAGDFVSMHTLYLFSHLKISRMVRHELIPSPLIAHSICTAHSHALQLLALVRDVRTTTANTWINRRRTTDFMSPFIAYAVASAIDTAGAGGLREEIVATTQVMSTATEVIQELSQHCSNARVQSRKAEKRLAQMESLPLEHDIRAGKSVDGRCWRINEPMEKTSSLRQDVMYGVSPSTFSDALANGRKR